LSFRLSLLGSRPIFAPPDVHPLDQRPTSLRSRAPTSVLHLSPPWFFLAPGEQRRLSAPSRERREHRTRLYSMRNGSLAACVLTRLVQRNLWSTRLFDASSCVERRKPVVEGRPLPSLFPPPQPDRSQSRRSLFLTGPQVGAGLFGSSSFFLLPLGGLFAFGPPSFRTRDSRRGRESEGTRFAFFDSPASFSRKCALSNVSLLEVPLVVRLLLMIFVSFSYREIDSWRAPLRIPGSYLANQV